MASIQYVVSATDLASAVFAKIAKSADGLDTQLEDLSKRVATPEVDLKDSKFTAGMISAAKRIDKLSAMMATPGADLEDPKFQAEMIKINAQLDRLDARHVTATVEVKTDTSSLSRLAGRAFGLGGGGGDRGLLGRIFGASMPAAGGAPGAGAQTGSGALAALGPGAQAAGIGVLIAAAVSLGPALVPTALGLMFGGGAAAGGLALGSAAQKQIAALGRSIPSGTTAADKLKTKQIQAQMASIRQQNAGPLAVLGGFTTLSGIAKQAFTGALTGIQGIPGVHFRAGPPPLTPLGIHGSGGPPGPSGALPGGRPVLQGPGGFPVPFQASFLTGLLGILKQFDRFVKSIGPQLGDMFRASIPFLKMFVHFLEQAAKTLLPVFTQMLRQMTPYLPMIGVGLMHIVDGLAGFLQALGPKGMQASAKIFIAFTIAMEYALKFLGIAINWLVEHVPGWVHDIAIGFDWLRHRMAVNAEHYRKIWDDFRHRTAVIFDGARHDIAHIWDMIFQNSIGMVIRLVHNVETQYNSLRHGIASTFDTIRHGIATAWDTIWNNTVTRVKNGISDVVGWFKGLPGKAIGALQGLGTSLYNFAHMALTKFWNGLKAVFTSVWNWFKSLPGKLLHAIGIASPPDWAIQAGKHIMGGILKGITSRKTELQSAFRSSVALGGDALANQALARKIFPWGADQWMPFVNLVMAESGFDRFARNPSSGAYGIAQALPPTKYPFAGQAAGGSHAGAQLSWMFNYIAQRYGTPAGAWAHELSAHWYGSGLRGGLFTSPTLIGVGERGPERVDVTPAGQSRGPVVQFGDVNIYNETDPVLLGQRISFAITAAGLA
jgi:hypothetical protein